MLMFGQIEALHSGDEFKAAQPQLAATRARTCADQESNWS